jgi:hypothetical protein
MFVNYQLQSISLPSFRMDLKCFLVLCVWNDGGAFGGPCGHVYVYHLYIFSSITTNGRSNKLQI